MVMQIKHLVLLLLLISTPGGGVLPYITYTLTHYLCAAQRGRDFEALDLERGIHFRDFC